MSERRKKEQKDSPALSNIQAAWDQLHEHPLFFSLVIRTHWEASEGRRCPPDGWAVVYEDGFIAINSHRLADPDVWVYVFAHCLLHLGLDHYRLPEDIHANERFDKNRAAWQAACDVFVARFLSSLKPGRPPEGYLQDLPLGAAQSEEQLYRRFQAGGIPAGVSELGLAGRGCPDIGLCKEGVGRPGFIRQHPDYWSNCLASGLARAARSAVNVAGGAQATLSDWSRLSTVEQARTWFINRYPLLGALASAFKIIADPNLCRLMGISVAAVDDQLREIYIHPAAGLGAAEMRFVIAHEMLHAGLRHRERCRGRDPYLWNVACDYVINGWLVEMKVGELPQMGLLYDPALKGLSAEAIYDRVVTDLRRYRKLATLRGVGLGDVLDSRPAERGADGESLDDFYRRCLAQGLVYHQAAGRGELPSGLVEEIEALSQPPIPWDVALARWFDEHFLPLEKMRTYARPSRRQSATPEIPRPSYVTPPGDFGRTYGVILDTSGSMDRNLLARALGTISNYSLARDVPWVRVVFCDAAPYDQGYLAPEDIAGRVQVKGRGGTVLQPAIDLLERAGDFPHDSPLLIITDGWCDRLHIRREHAFLMPPGARLPFAVRGDIFWIAS